MRLRVSCLAVCGGLLLAACSAPAQDIPPLTAEESAAAAADYQQYCSLCHGADRQGFVNDNAPSLRSKSLYHTRFPEFILFTIAYGRRGTPMGGFFDEVGGPMNNEEIYRLTRWLREQVGVESVDYPAEHVAGDVQRGRQVFKDQCAQCHGENGEGGKGPAIANPAFLALATDAFLRYTIQHGRDGTEMAAFGEMLPAADIDAVTAFLRSRETAWTFEKPVLAPPPKPGEYVLNPEGAPPDFPLDQGLYVKSKDLDQALREKRRMVILDARVASMWQIGHIEGAVPVPYYYKEFDRLAAELPQDGTWIVSYCECPRSAAESVTKKLRAAGFANTAVLWEGIQGWISLGYPVAAGAVQAATE